MSAPWRARISAPKQAAAGEVVRIKTLVSHPMETGFRRDSRGEPIPRNILVRFRCWYDERLVVDIDLHPAVSANPYFAFDLRADRSAELRFEWVDQSGLTTEQRRAFDVA